MVTVAAATETTHGGMSLLQLRPAQLLTSVADSSALVLLPGSPQGGGPVALLHVPYNHVAVNITYHNLHEQILTFPQRKPKEFNVMLATCKTFSADAIVQLLELRRGMAWKFDWRRSAAFACFGFFYIGITQWCLYVTFMTWLFPQAMIFANSPMSMKLTDSVGQLDMIGQVMVDNFVFSAFIAFPVFYVIKAMVQDASSSLEKRVQIGLNRYYGNCVKDNMFACAIWIPADIFIFACPMYLRMPLDHGVSFGFTMFMSFYRGAAADKEKYEAKLEM